MTESPKFAARHLRGFKIPLLVALIVSLSFGLGLGWKLRRDRAAQLGVVTSSRKLRLLALAGSIPPSVLRGFRSAENIAVELVEEKTPDDVAGHLESDASFDLVTLLSTQTSHALQTSRIQPFNTRDIKNFETISRDFIDLPQPMPTTAPFAWGILGFAFNSETVKPVQSWADVFDLGHETHVIIKPLAFEISRLAKKNMPQPFAENALQDRIKKFQGLYKRADRFLVDPTLTKADGDVVELSFSEATIPAYKEMKFVLPTEHALLWILNLALTSGAKNAEEAIAFTNYVLKPAVAVEIANANHEASTNLGVESSALLPTQKPSSLRRIPLTQLDFAFEGLKN
jgi:spermidine/putrescine transport system substrate-binding protein